MKKISKKILSAFLALAMVLGVAGSAFVSKAQSTSTKVVVHKLALKNLNGWPKTPGADGTITGLDGSSYNGSEIANIASYFGEGTEEIAGVEFFYWTLTKEQYDYMMKNPGNYDTVEKVEAFFDKVNGDTAFNATDGAGATAKESKDSETTTLHGFEVTLNDGYYWFVENFGSRLLHNDTDKTISKAAAVPFGLALPIYKADGNRFDDNNPLHVYPKNKLAAKPKTDKNFLINEDDDAEIRLDDPNRAKDDKNVFAGEVVPYKVVTEIPAGSKYKTAMWSDRMTEGLTFNPASIKVEIAGQQVDNSNYVLTHDERGFTLKLNEKGLALISTEDGPVKVKLTYTATVNENILVDIPEANDVTFYYGNNPTTVTNPTPKPQKPKDGSLKVEKQWDGKVPDNFTVKVKLVNAQTGVDVPGKTATLTKDNPTYTWTDLDNSIEYKVVEYFEYAHRTVVTEDDLTNLFVADYSTPEAGKTVITNHKDENPQPQNPSEPKVVTGGKRFQKVDFNTREGLAGVKFYVKAEGENKYLAKKDSARSGLDQVAYVAAEKAYKEAVKKGQDATELKKARDEAYKAVNTEWEWVDDVNRAFEIVSNTDGYFKITGLAYGNYSLVEKEALTGYAKISDPVPFTVAAESHEATTLEDGKLKDEKMKEVENKKITIPETGGMGTVIFTVVGIAIMGGAIFAMRRRSQEQ